MATDALRALWAEPRPTNPPGPGAAGLGLGRSTDRLVRGGSGASPGPGATPGPDLDWPGAAPAAAARGARGPRPPAVATHAPARRGCGLLRHVDDRRHRQNPHRVARRPPEQHLRGADPGLRPVPVGLR